MAGLREIIFELLDNAVENGPFSDYGFNTPDDIVFDLQCYSDEMLNVPYHLILQHVDEWLSERGVKIPCD